MADSHTKEQRPLPIRVGDEFRMSTGSVWKVIETRPGGKLELFNEAECRFASLYHRDVRQWERVK